jgi:hypothetical protein
MAVDFVSPAESAEFLLVALDLSSERQISVLVCRPAEKLGI